MVRRPPSSTRSCLSRRMVSSRTGGAADFASAAPGAGASDAGGALAGAVGACLSSGTAAGGAVGARWLGAARSEGGASRLSAGGGAGARRRGSVSSGAERTTGGFAAGAVGASRRGGGATSPFCGADLSGLERSGLGPSRLGSSCRRPSGTLTSGRWPSGRRPSGRWPSGFLPGRSCSPLGFSPFPGSFSRLVFSSSGGWPDAGAGAPWANSNRPAAFTAGTETLASNATSGTRPRSECARMAAIV